jgi:5-formyltetrahydrofolate cyclo-ligase
MISLLLFLGTIFSSHCVDAALSILLSRRVAEGRNRIYRPLALSSSFNEEAFEKDRLEKDAQAMYAMKEEAERQYSNLRTPWKWVIRKRIWDLLEERDIARPPRPVHHRIPNYDGAEVAAQRLTSLPEYVSAKCIKVNPDTPQRPVRQLVLEDKKTLLTPQPRLRTGFFSILRKDTLPEGVSVSDVTISKGVAKYGTPVGLNEKYKVDLVVVGSTAVCPDTGARVGKGEGFAELEWGILSLQGNLNATNTLVVTTVHDEQVIQMPEAELTKHDVPVDIIVTPTRVIRVSNRKPKPSGVYWDLLSPQKLSQIRVLRQLKSEIEATIGTTLPTGPDEVLPPTAKRNNPRKRT